MLNASKTPSNAASATLTERYLQITSDLNALIGGRKDFPYTTALVSLIALLKEQHGRISWVGVYLERGVGTGHLFVGPYQGKIACVEIPRGKGVCGASFEQKKTLIVPDVEAFPGHIACDSLSRSEIVVPLYQGGKLIGVLDLDSHELDAFNETDQAELEKLLALIDSLPA